MIREGQYKPTSSVETGEELDGSPPKLRFIRRALELLHSDRDGETPDPKEHWTRVYENVKPWESGIELSDNIRAAVQEFVEHKMPRVKKRIPSFGKLPNKALLEALVHNWFEGVEEAVGGQRREVLLAVMAHVVNKVETVAWKETLKHTDKNGRGKLGLDADTRELLVRVLDIASTADQLFIRFLAYTQMSGKPPEEASREGLFVPHDTQPHTIAKLFPKETRYLADNLALLVGESAAWTNKPGGKEFQAFLKTLGLFYRATTVEEAGRLLQEIEQRYSATVTSGFPILVTPAFEGYQKEPYLDPELRISLTSPDARQENDQFHRAQLALGKAIDTLGVGRFRTGVEQRPFRTVVSVGSYGVNLVFKAVAQEDRAVVLYADEQRRAYDREYSESIKLIKNSAQAFSTLEMDKRAVLFGRMSRMNTMLHEFGHPVYPDGSIEAKRLGRVPLTSIDEVKAEMMYRGVLRELIAEGAVEGTQEQWAAALLASSIQQLKDNSPGEPYYHAAVYPLNCLVERGAIAVENNRVVIRDVGTLYEVLNQGAHEVLALYEDGGMTEQKAARWVRVRCSPNAEVAKLEALVKKE